MIRRARGWWGSTTLTAFRSGDPGSGIRHQRVIRHRTENDPGQPYEFKDVETLIDDFFSEVERKLGERGIGTMVVRVDETRGSS